MAKQKLNLFQFASRAVAQAGASAAKVVGREIVYAGLSERTASLRTRPRLLSRQRVVTFPPSNLPEYFTVAHSGMPEPGIDEVPWPTMALVRFVVVAPLPTKLTMTQWPSLDCS